MCAYFGTMSLKSSILIRPAGVLPTVMSKKTTGRGPALAGADMSVSWLVGGKGLGRRRSVVWGCCVVS